MFISLSEYYVSEYLEQNIIIDNNWKKIITAIARMVIWLSKAFVI